MPSNRWEHAARMRKTQALADVVWSWLTDEERCDPNLATVLATWGNARRDALAEAAGQRRPSAETWAALCDRLGVMVDCERARAEQLRRVG